MNCQVPTMSRLCLASSMYRLMCTCMIYHHKEWKTWCTQWLSCWAPYSLQCSQLHVTCISSGQPIFMYNMPHCCSKDIYGLEATICFGGARSVPSECSMLQFILTVTKMLATVWQPSTTMKCTCRIPLTIPSTARDIRLLQCTSRHWESSAYTHGMN